MDKERPAILIVDDNRGIGDILYEKLRSKGYYCCVAESADDALTKLRDRIYNVVLLDVKLPGKSGVDLLKDFKSAHSDTILIMVSAVVDLDTKGEAMRRMAFDYIVKPFDLHDVVLSVERALGYQYLNAVWRGRLGMR